ncbi:MAG: peptidoglycan DD-metalloendopeptidase family protein [Gemmatimonadota bacterium]
MPDSSGWGTHVLTVATAPDGAVWVGTYGQGIYVSRDGSGREWENLRSRDSTSISWDFVNAIAFHGDQVWYGTIGNGWGVSRDGGRTWRNWTFDELGPRWLYVAPGGIGTAADTVYVATADGLRILSAEGDSVRAVAEPAGIASRYLTGLRVSPGPGAPRIAVRHLRGVSVSEDGGRTWAEGSESDLDSPDAEDARPLVREIRRWMEEEFRRYPDPRGSPARPGRLEHFWFRRPVAPEDNPHFDQTYTYGSTMGGNFQQHQGVEFNNPEGTPVQAIGDGTVAYAGEAEAGSLTVAILHDRRFGRGYVWSTYYHNSALDVRSGERVREGQTIARVGSTGRATNDHLHLEIHVTPTADVERVVSASVRYPPFTRNPQLWIEPLPGTGAIAGRVVDAAGRAVPGARVYGVTKPLPRETPFSFAETYEERAHPDPAFAEHFAIGDVPAGSYVLGVEIDGRRVFREAVVEEGRVTVVELRP